VDRVRRADAEPADQGDQADPGIDQPRRRGREWHVVAQRPVRGDSLRAGAVEAAVGAALGRRPVAVGLLALGHDGSPQSASAPAAAFFAGAFLAAAFLAGAFFAAAFFAGALRDDFFGAGPLARFSASSSAAR